MTDLEKQYEREMNPGIQRVRIWAARFHSSRTAAVMMAVVLWGLRLAASMLRSPRWLW